MPISSMYLADAAALSGCAKTRHRPSNADAIALIGRWGEDEAQEWKSSRRASATVVRTEAETDTCLYGMDAATLIAR